MKYANLEFSPSMSVNESWFNDGVPYMLEDLLYYVDRNDVMYAYKVGDGWYEINSVGDIKKV